MMKNLHGLIQSLETLSPNIAGMGLGQKRADAPLVGKLINLANDKHALRLVSGGIESLVNDANVSVIEAESMLGQLLTERHFYGSFCELGIYGWLARNRISFQAQIQLGPSDVLNPNGCAIDGMFENFASYFDIKGFGMQAYLLQLLKEKLWSAASQFQYTIDGPLDVSVKDIETYGFGAIAGLVPKLNDGLVYKISELGWTIRVHNPKPISISEHTTDPYGFAEQNRYYPLKTARQFTRQKPFILIFPFAAQFNSMLASNVFSTTDTALRALARRVFMQLDADAAPLKNFDPQTPDGLTVSDAAKLISGLMFIDLDKDAKGSRDDGWLFINPRATNRLSKYHVDQLFDFMPPVGLGIDYFEHDNY